MATSMLPVDFVYVSGELYRAAQYSYPGLYCNLRPEQQARSEVGDVYDLRHCLLGNTVFVHKQVRMFLEALKPSSKVLMHFQGYGKNAVGTALVRIDSVYWTREPYPRLDFKHPAALAEIHGCPNFWGAFILAITVACEENEEFATEDKHGRVFLQKMRELGLGQDSTFPRYVVRQPLEGVAQYHVHGKDDATCAVSRNRTVSYAVERFLNELPYGVNPEEVVKAFVDAKFMPNV